MENNIQVNMQMIINMEKAYLNGLMGGSTWGSGSMGSKMVQEFTSRHQVKEKWGNGLMASVLNGTQMMRQTNL